MSNINLNYTDFVHEFEKSEKRGCGSPYLNEGYVTVELSGKTLDALKAQEGKFRAIFLSERGLISRVFKLLSRDNRGDFSSAAEAWTALSKVGTPDKVKLVSDDKGEEIPRCPAIHRALPAH